MVDATWGHRFGLKVEVKQRVGYDVININGKACKKLLKRVCPSLNVDVRLSRLLYPYVFLTVAGQWAIVILCLVWHTCRSFGVFLSSGFFSRQSLTKPSASWGNRPSGVNFGAGSLTICCNSSSMLIIIPPPCRLTPLLFRLSFLLLFFFLVLASRFRPPGCDGDNVPSKSENSDSESSDDSEKGNRPKASSISVMPRDQTSDLTVYWAPWIRSGCVQHYINSNGLRRFDVRSCTLMFRRTYQQWSWSVHLKHRNHISWFLPVNCTGC